MKALKSIFKKNVKENSKIKIEKLDKANLEKVVGGADVKTPIKSSDPTWISNTCAV